MLNSVQRKTDFACFYPATGLDMAIADTMQACKPMTVKASKYAVGSYKVNAKYEIRKSRLASQVARLATTISNPENKIIAIGALLSREAKKVGAKRDAYSTMEE
jgi:hypothetical protein